jgi:Flp pilus assembly protein TadB
MSPVGLLAAVAVGLGAAAVAGVLRPPTRRLAPRVRPYAIVARTALGHPPQPVNDATITPAGGTLGRLFGPPAHALVTRTSRMIESRSDERIARQLRQAGYPDAAPNDYRVRQVLSACVAGVVAAAATELLVSRPVLALVAGAAGFVFGATRVRRRLERAIAERAARMRLELYTVNHLLAMHVRTGAGAMQAVQRVVDRGHGAVVDELADVLTWTRSGMGEADAFRRAAELTPEPSAARTYQLLAGGVERGVDLGAGLLALSADIRDARREQLHKDAVRRRAAMLVPTIAILAPIMLLFIAAPLPSIVLGHR